MFYTKTVVAGFKWETDVEAYFLAAQALGVSNATAKRILDDETARAQTHPLGTNDGALIAAKRRLLG